MHTIMREFWKPTDMESTECLGPAVTFFLSPPEKVRRRNGTRVQLAPRISDLEELKALGRLMIRKEVALL